MSDLKMENSFLKRTCPSFTIHQKLIFDPRPVQPHFDGTRHKCDHFQIHTYILALSKKDGKPNKA